MPRANILYGCISFTLVMGLAFTTMLVFGLFGPADGVGAVFCEASRNGLIKQPANTWSNMAFVIFGLLMAFQLAHGLGSHLDNRFAQSDLTALGFSCLNVFLGFGSMAMHATESHMGGFLDMLSMHLLTGFITAYAAQRYFGWGNGLFTVVFLAIPAVSVTLQDLPLRVPVVGYLGNLIFGFFILCTIAFEWLNSYKRQHCHERKWALLSLVVVALSFGIWNMWHNNSPLCRPGSLIQGHAMWHMLDALAAYFLFRYYVSESGAVLKNA